ncbi:MAG TPA: hypothetical protein VF538_10595 [Pyrinomonadaceae bacterium]|jgi:hypothetical protein
MSTSADCNEDELLADRETWTAILEPTLCQDSAAVECLARRLFVLKKSIDGEQGGAARASKTLLCGIEQMYLYTDAHRAALKLYVLSLDGTLTPQEEPLPLINAAIERAGGRRV